MIAFGVTFAYPIIGVVRDAASTRVPAGPAHAPRSASAGSLIAPPATVALLAGFYLASDRDYMGKIWVIVPLVILIGLLGLGGAFFGAQREAAPPSWRAATSHAAGADGAVTLSPEYDARRRTHRARRRARERASSSSPSSSWRRSPAATDPPRSRVEP